VGCSRGEPKAVFRVGGTVLQESLARLDGTFRQLLRRAIIGSMRDARRAGMYPATSAIQASSRTMPANVAGSVGSVPKSSEAIHLATANDATVPTAIPSNASRSVP